MGAGYGLGIATRMVTAWSALKGRYLRVHRVVYELFVSPIPAGQHVLHSCDNPPCCNPKHLSLGSHDDNMRDMAVRGRAKGRPGIMHNCVKLTEDQVREIRSRWLVGGETQQAIADAYGVSQSHVSEIVSGKYWKALK